MQNFWFFTWCLFWTLGSSKCSSLNLFHRYYFGRYWSELAQLVSLPYSGGSSTRFSDRLQSWFFCHHSQMLRNVYVYSFFPGAAGLWNSLPIECFPLIYDSNGFKYIINTNFNCSFFLNKFHVCFNFFVFLFLITS